jgi:hypothetical protein
MFLIDALSPALLLKVVLLRSPFRFDHFCPRSSFVPKT